MRIGFLGPFSSHANADYGAERQIGAIEQQIFGVGQELAKLGHEVYVSRNWEGDAEEDMVNGVHLVNVNLSPRARQGFFDSTFPLSRVSLASHVFLAPLRLRAQELDVLVVPGVIPAFVSSIFFDGLRIPKVFLAINNDIFVHQGGGHTRFPRATRTMIRTISRRYDATVALTLSGQTYLRSLGVDCGFVIPGAVHPERYRCEPEEGFILTAGRLVPHKRIADLLRAFSAVADDIQEGLQVVGSGPCEATIRQLATRLGIDARVQFNPFLPQSLYRDRLSRCSFFVLPSVAEAFGVVVIEAMASGKPAIVRDTIGPRDIVTHGYDGTIFRTQAELEDDIRLLSGDKGLRNRLGANARDTVEKRFGFRNAARLYEQLFDSLNR